jgi:hypothetical protein
VVGDWYAMWMCDAQCVVVVVVVVVVLVFGGGGGGGGCQGRYSVSVSI